MGRMIADSEVVFDQLGHAPTGPNLAAKAEGFGPFEQQGDELSTLLGVEQGGGTRSRLVAQGADAVQTGPLEPLADRTLANAEGLGDQLLRPAHLMQFPGTKAATFMPTKRRRVL